MSEATLKVLKAPQDDMYSGAVRMDAEVMRKLGVFPGKIVEIEGERRTVAVVNTAYPVDLGWEVIRMDRVLKKNAKTHLHGSVKIRKVDPEWAKSIVISSKQNRTMREADLDALKTSLQGRAIVKDDIIVLKEIKRKKMSSGSPFEEIFEYFERGLREQWLKHPLGPLGLELSVVETDPEGPVVISKTTEIKING